MKVADKITVGRMPCCGKAVFYSWREVTPEKILELKERDLIVDVIPEYEFRRENSAPILDTIERARLFARRLSKADEVLIQLERHCDTCQNKKCENCYVCFAKEGLR